MSRYVIQISDHGYWVTDTAKGRSRFIAASPEEVRVLTEQEAVRASERAARQLGREPKVYYRDSDGKIGIPPEPTMVPADCQRFECNSLAEEDAIAREMTEELHNKWKEDGFTEIFDGMMGEMTGNRGPREELVRTLASGPRGRKEADAIRVMLKDLDAEQANRERITANVFFHNREYDR